MCSLYFSFFFCFDKQKENILKEHANERGHTLRIQGVNTKKTKQRIRKQPQLKTKLSTTKTIYKSHHSELPISNRTLDQSKRDLIKLSFNL